MIQYEKTIFIIVPSLKKGGAERFISNFVKAFQSEFHVHLIILDSSEQAYEILLRPGLSVEYFNFKKVIYSLPLLTKRFLLEKPVLVFSTLGNLNLYLCILKFLLNANFKLVVRPILLASDEKRTGRVSYLNFYLSGLFLRMADVIVCQSEDMRRDYMENYPNLQPKLVVINNMMNPEIEVLRQGICPVNLKHLPVRFIAVGRLVEQKGFDILIETFALLKDLPIELRIFGSGILFESLNKRIIELGLEDYVILAGDSDKIYEEYLMSDYFILPSRYEGFPNVLIEALALGLPAIVLPCSGGIFEIMRRSSAFGTITEDRTPIILASAIREQLDSVYCRVNFNDTSIYRPEVIVKQYLDVFRNVLVL